MPYDPENHHRHTIRLAGYDYSQAGAYFVTLVAKDRENLFGEITDDMMCLSLVGECAASIWSGLPDHFNVILGVWVLMPNHLHGIVILENMGGVMWKEGEAFGDNRLLHRQSLRPNASPLRGTVPGSLNAIVQNYKSVSTRYINRLRNRPGVPVWQRDYYERVVRSEKELDQIAAYIESNPINWEKDQEFRH